MQPLEILLTSLSSIGLAHALFMSVMLWFWNRGNRYLNQMLSVLLFALAVRISKSVLFFLLENTPELAPAVGVTGQAAIGPALFIYVRDFIRKDNKNISFNIFDLVHFLPVLFILIAIPFHTILSLYYTYLLVIAHLFLYLAVSTIHAWNRQNTLHKTFSITWVGLLLTGSFIIWGVYVSQLIGGSTFFYLIVTSISALVLFGLSFTAMFNYNVLSRTPNLNGKEKIHGVYIEGLKKKLEILFEERKIFINPDLTLNHLSNDLEVPSYIISKVVNNKFRQSFPEFVNSFRMKEAERLLKDPEYNHLSIEAIAFDCGFNSLSVFYNVFKKYHGETPAQFRERSM